MFDASAPDVIVIHRLADAATSGFDGTTGNTCSSTTECRPPGGAGLNVCSNQNVFTIGPVFPTPVCVLPSCNPGQDGNVHFCDGPDQPGSPGVCLATDSTGASGVCLPVCTIPLNGAPPSGCQGRDICNFASVLLDATTGQPMTGIGFCQGGCQADADCPTGSSCQTTEGICVTSVKNPTKQLGQACTSTDSQNQACNCLLTNDSPTAGYCTQFCTLGGAPCPTGYVCDTGQPSMLTDASGNTIPGFANENAGLAGTCNQTCAGAGDSSGACPPNSACGSSTSRGPVCVP